MQKPWVKLVLIGLFLGVSVLPACAWNNDYQSTNNYDSYSQSWNSFKQQNNINTQPAYQQSWWNNAINSVGNFLADIGSAVNTTLNNIGSFFTNIAASVHDFFIKPPEIKANLDTTPSSIDNAKAADAINRVPTSSVNIKQNLSSNKFSDTAQSDKYATKTDTPTAKTTNQKQYTDFWQEVGDKKAVYQSQEWVAIADKWSKADQAQPVASGVIHESTISQNTSDPLFAKEGAGGVLLRPADQSALTLQQTSQKNIDAAAAAKAIMPLQIKPAQADIMPVGSREVFNAAPSTVKNTLITTVSPNNIKYILDKEVTGIDKDTALTNIKTAFAGHNELSQMTMGNKIKEYVEVVGREKIVDAVFGFFAKGASDVLELCGVKNFAQTNMNPTYKTITALDSQRFLNIYRDFDKAINNGYDVGHGYISTRYAPGKIENFINNAGEIAFSHIPIVGNINLGAPQIGDYVHVARFVTVDSLGYYRMTQLTYNYGTFKDPGGNYHEGATFADLKVYRAELPGDSNAWSGYILEKHERVPLL